MNYFNNIIKLNNLFTQKCSSVVPNISTTMTLKGDSGATNHYIATSDSELLTNTSSNTDLNVTLPNNDTLQSTTMGNLPIPKLSSTASTAYVLPGFLSNTSLLSLGQLADDNCLILLDKKYLRIFKNFELILKGYRNRTDGL